MTSFHCGACGADFKIDGMAMVSEKRLAALERVAKAAEKLAESSFQLFNAAATEDDWGKANQDCSDMYDALEELPK